MAEGLAEKWAAHVAAQNEIDEKIDALALESVGLEIVFAAEHAPVKPGETVDVVVRGQKATGKVMAVGATNPIDPEKDTPAWNVQVRVLNKNGRNDKRFNAPVWGTMQPMEDGGYGRIRC